MAPWWGTFFGGAVSALVLRSAVKLLGLFITSRKPVAAYDCATDGAEGEPAAFRHGWGLRIDPAFEPGGEKLEYRVDNQPLPADRQRAWLYSLDRPRGRDRQHVQYGPYTNDFGRPGYFRVSFLIAGERFASTDRPVLVLDVIQSPFSKEQGHHLLAQRTITARELSPSYRSFDVPCYTSGVGVYEYRVTVIPGAVDIEQHRLFFKQVLIYPDFKLWEVF